MPERTSPTANEPQPLSLHHLSQFGSDLATAAILLALLGRGGWLAYEHGWPPLGQRSDFVDAPVATNSPADELPDDPAPTPSPSEIEESELAPAQQQLSAREPSPPVKEVEDVPPAAPAPEVSTPVETKSESPSPSGKVVRGNVALSRRGAIVSGPYKGRESLLDGQSEGYGKAKLYCPIVVSLPEVFQLDSVRLHLIAAWLPNNSKDSFYQFTVEVSEDGVNYQTVADRTSGRHRDWQEITFSPRSVQSIRITGTYDHPHQTGIRIAEIEAYCTSW